MYILYAKYVLLEASFIETLCIIGTQVLLVPPLQPGILLISSEKLREKVKISGDGPRLTGVSAAKKIVKVIFSKKLKEDNKTVRAFLPVHF